jgi:hypothetical protein
MVWVYVASCSVSRNFAIVVPVLAIFTNKVFVSDRLKTPLFTLDALLEVLFIHVITSAYSIARLGDYFQKQAEV